MAMTLVAESDNAVWKEGLDITWDYITEGPDGLLNVRDVEARSYIAQRRPAPPGAVRRGMVRWRAWCALLAGRLRGFMRHERGMLGVAVDTASRIL
jgi:hypothetical protein